MLFLHFSWCISPSHKSNYLMRNHVYHGITGCHSLHFFDSCGDHLLTGYSPADWIALILCTLGKISRAPESSKDFVDNQESKNTLSPCLRNKKWTISKIDRLQTLNYFLTCRGFKHLNAQKTSPHFENFWITVLYTIVLLHCRLWAGAFWHVWAFSSAKVFRWWV